MSVAPEIDYENEIILLYTLIPRIFKISSQCHTVPHTLDPRTLDPPDHRTLAHHTLDPLHTLDPHTRIQGLYSLKMEIQQNSRIHRTEIQVERQLENLHH